VTFKLLNIVRTVRYQKCDVFLLDRSRDLDRGRARGTRGEGVPRVGCHARVTALACGDVGRAGSLVWSLVR
jgi:hypothetical protein